MVCCFLLRCLVLYESKVGVMRKDDGNGGWVREGVEKEVVMGDCWGWSVWKGRVRVDGWYRLREAIANN